MKVTKLKKVEQESRTMKKFVQKFRRDSGYEERSLVNEFKREMNRVIQKKYIETERYPRNIKEWYEYATNLDRH